MNRQELYNSLLEKNIFYYKKNNNLRMNPKNSETLTKRYPELLNEIYLSTNYLLPETKLNERLFHVLHGLTHLHKCAECNIPLKFGSGYANTCSPKCNTAWIKKL